MEISEDKIQISRVYESASAKIWEALTNPPFQKEWYFDFGGTWKLEVGYLFEGKAGDPPDKLWLRRGKILEVIQGKKLVHSWEHPGYSGYTILTW